MNLVPSCEEKQNANPSSLCSSSKQSKIIKILNGRLSHQCSSLSHVQLFMTPWTVACQAPLSMVFSRQKILSEISLAQGLNILAELGRQHFLLPIIVPNTQLIFNKCLMGGLMKTDYQILEEFNLDVYKLYIYIYVYIQQNIQQNC